METQKGLYLGTEISEKWRKRYVWNGFLARGNGRYWLDKVSHFDRIIYMARLNLKNIVWKEGKYYVAQCLNVDVSSFGKTRKEALKNLDEALELYFEDIKTPRIAKIERPEVVEFFLTYA